MDLQNVTLCAADSIHPQLAARALETSAIQCRFGDSILFTHEAVPTSARIVPIPRLQSREDYSDFMIKQLVRHVSTPWVLVIQWDGYVLDGAAWSDAFFDYDYIGAVWPFHRDGMTVGNGGFSLRSAKLLHALADERIQLPYGVSEDEFICRQFRPQLEADSGIRFAPAEIASRFAYEHERPGAPTFGFHAAFNMWRHVDDDTMIGMINTLEQRTYASREVLQLLIAYCELRKFDCIKAMYMRYRQIWNEAQFVQSLQATGVSHDLVVLCADLCERSIGNEDRKGFCE